MQCSNERTASTRCGRRGRRQLPVHTGYLVGVRLSLTETWVGRIMSDAGIPASFVCTVTATRYLSMHRLQIASNKQRQAATSSNKRAGHLQSCRAILSIKDGTQNRQKSPGAGLPSAEDDLPCQGSPQWSPHSLPAPVARRAHALERAPDSSGGPHISRFPFLVFLVKFPPLSAPSRVADAPPRPHSCED